ncbi:MAG: hypothetical protein M3068_08540 [Gemmatimonadota bacterium]|nr:hypothetical protein [Gemmatimonadota bacterium]
MPALAPRSSTLTAREVGIVGLICAAVGAVLFRPWQNTVFPIQDWGNHLALYATHHGFRAQLDAMTSAYESEGRFSPITYLALVTNWTVFGFNATGWQAARFLLMVASAVAAAILFRRLGASHASALAGALLLLCAPQAGGLYRSPQMQDPIAMLLLTAAAFLAVSFQTARRPVLASFAIATLCTLAIWDTETFVVCAPFVLLIALCRQPDGEFVLPLLTRRNAVLVAVMGGMIFLFAATPVLLVKAHASATSYTASYSLRNITAAETSNVLRGTFLPVTRVPLFPANILYLATLLFGLTWFVRDCPRTTHPILLIAGALSLPLLGTLIYLPWPAYPGHYAYKYLLGVGLLIALALAAIERRAGRRLGGVAYGAWALVLLWGALFTRNDLSAEMARRQVDAEAAAALPALVPSRVVVASVNPASTGYMGQDLWLYAFGSGFHPLPHVQDLRCGDATALTSSSVAGVSVLVLPEQCTAPGTFITPPTQVITAPYIVRDWRTLRTRGETVVVRIWTRNARDNSLVAGSGGMPW